MALAHAILREKKDGMVPDRLVAFLAHWAGSIGLSRGTRRGGLLLALAVVPSLCWVLGVASCSMWNDRSAEDSRKLLKKEPDIRVRIKKTAEVAEISAGAGATQLVLRPLGVGRAEMVEGPLTVRSSAGGLSIAVGAEPTRPFGAGVDVEILAVSGGEADSSAPLKVDGVTYPGLIRLRARSDDSPDRFDVIATMSIEEYLPGVVVKEMYPNWPAEAFKVQAVCSRSYALHERERSRATGKLFDVESSTLDQVYGGATANSAAKAAVEETRGVVLMYAGKVLRAYYSSTCGGRSASAADIFPTSAGFEFNLAAPLQAKEREAYCEKSPWYRWDVVRPADDLSLRMKAWGKHAGKSVKNAARIESVEAVTMNVADRPARYLIKDSKGATFELNAEELRLSCNFTPEGQPAITKETRVNSGDVLVEVTGATARLRGRGFGHGVGMCQWCAKAMTERDKDWKTILAGFYPGANLKEAY